MAVNQNKFNSFSIKFKVEVLYLYLVKGVAQTEIEKKLWPSETRKAFNASTIANGYGVTGKEHRGRFPRATKEQIYQYVNDHPDYDESNDILSYLRRNEDFEFQYSEQNNEVGDRRLIIYVIGSIVVFIIGYMLLMFLYNLLKPIIDFIIQNWLMIFLIVVMVGLSLRKRN